MLTQLSPVGGPSWGIGIPVTPHTRGMRWEQNGEGSANETIYKRSP